MHSGYLDRFTDTNDALILVDSLQQQFHVPASFLPANSAAGTWLLVEIQDNEITAVQIDIEKTQAMAQEIENRMQRLKSKKTSRFRRS